MKQFENLYQMYFDSDDASLKFDLDDYDNVAEISAEIDKLKNEKGKTNIAAGLRMAEKRVFVPEGGHREDARGVIFLLTDGRDTQSSDYADVARDLHDRGIGETIQYGSSEFFR